MKYAVINHSTDGDNEIVAAVSNKRIKVLQYVISSDQNVDVAFKSGSSTELTGPLHLVAHGHIHAAYGSNTPAGLVAVFETAVGQALVMDINGAKTVGGHITYIVTD